MEELRKIKYEELEKFVGCRVICTNDNRDEIIPATLVKGNFKDFEGAKIKGYEYACVFDGFDSLKCTYAHIAKKMYENHETHMFLPFEIVK